MLPEFDSDGELPPGIHVGTLAEIEQRFGRFTTSERRAKLFAKLSEIVNLAQSSGIVERIYLGGSFITAKPTPNDVDLIFALSADVDFAALTPSQYLVTNRKAMRRVITGEDFDLMVVRADTEDAQAAIEFFQTNRDNKEVGLVEVRL